MVVSRQVANIDSQNLTDEHLTDLDHLVIQGLDNPLLNQHCHGRMQIWMKG